MFSRLQSESTAIVESVVELVYFMRGSVTYEEMMRRTPGERQLIDEFLKKRLKAESKSPHPVY